MINRARDGPEGFGMGGSESMAEEKNKGEEKENRKAWWKRTRKGWLTGKDEWETDGRRREGRREDGGRRSGESGEMR